MNVTEYDVSAERGFLPEEDPAETLPGDFAIYDDVGVNVPALLRNGTLRECVMDELGEFLTDIPTFTREIKRLSTPHARLLFTRTAFTAHAFAHGNRMEKPWDFLPEGLAAPLYVLGRRFGVPPLLIYAVYALWNWRRMDKNAGIVTENLDLLQYFEGSLDERWFVAIHQEIEATAAPLILASARLHDEIARPDTIAIEKSMEEIWDTLSRMRAILSRMTEGCDFYIYFECVRRYLHGWLGKNFPNGVEYRGVPGKNGAWFRCFARGQTGAQSSIIPVTDGALGILHEASELTRHLDTMLFHTPKSHRDFIQGIGAGSTLSPELIARLFGKPSRQYDLYRECRRELALFRLVHFTWAWEYIKKQIPLHKDDQGGKGTGYTDFIPSLSKHATESVLPEDKEWLEERIKHITAR
ncbi:indoleamine 2,3-dioxygenase [bacterium]|nr:indoleamine 2,3-dioxygenase [bacterium]